MLTWQKESCLYFCVIDYMFSIFFITLYLFTFHTCMSHVFIYYKTGLNVWLCMIFVIFYHVIFYNLSYLHMSHVFIDYMPHCMIVYETCVSAVCSRRTWNWRCCVTRTASAVRPTSTWWGMWGPTCTSTSSRGGCNCRWSILLTYQQTSWNNVPCLTKMYILTLRHNVQRHMGQSEDWIFWVSLVMRTCNVWC